MKNSFFFVLLFCGAFSSARAQNLYSKITTDFPPSVVMKLYNFVGKVAMTPPQQVEIATILLDEEQQFMAALNSKGKLSAAEVAELNAYTQSRIDSVLVKEQRDVVHYNKNKQDAEMYARNQLKKWLPDSSLALTSGQMKNMLQYYHQERGDELRSLEALKKAGKKAMNSEQYAAAFYNTPTDPILRFAGKLNMTPDQIEKVNGAGKWRKEKQLDKKADPNAVKRAYDSLVYHSMQPLQYDALMEWSTEESVKNMVDGILADFKTYSVVKPEALTSAEVTEINTYCKAITIARRRYFPNPAEREENIRSIMLMEPQLLKKLRAYKKIHGSGKNYQGTFKW